MHRPLNLIFLFPAEYRPLKANFARQFELLSESGRGYIFTACNARYRDLTIGNFRLYAARLGKSVVIRTLNRLWVQTVVPAWLLLGRFRVDAVVAHDPYASGLAGIILKLLFRSRLIVEIPGDYHRWEPATGILKRWMFQLLLHCAVGCADAIQVLNTDQEEFLRRRYPTKPIFRFPAFVATGYFRALESYQGDYLLAVGYPFDLKGMDVLIRAFRRIADKHPAKRLRIMGYCPPRELDKYRRLAENDPRVEFLKPGWIEDVGEQMRGCYALVNAARSEAMGRVHVEAMACGKPVVATRTNGGMACVEDGRTGLLCEIGEVDDLAAKLDYVLSNPKLASEFGEAGLERLQAQFSEEKQIGERLDMLGAVLGVSPRKSPRGSVADRGLVGRVTEKLAGQADGEN